MTMLLTECTELRSVVGSTGLDEVSDVHGHLVDAGVVELLNVVQCALVFVSHEVDGNALTAKPTASADPVDVVFSVGGKVIVDDQRHLLAWWQREAPPGCLSSTDGTRHRFGP